MLFQTVYSLRFAVAPETRSINHYDIETFTANIEFDRSGVENDKKQPVLDTRDRNPSRFVAIAVAASWGKEGSPFTHQMNRFLSVRLWSVRRLEYGKQFFVYPILKSPKRRVTTKSPRKMHSLQNSPKKKKKKKKEMYMWRGRRSLRITVNGMREPRPARVTERRIAYTNTYHPMYHGTYPGAISARRSSMRSASSSVPNSVLYGKNWHGVNSSDADRSRKSWNPNSADRVTTFGASAATTTGRPVYA